MRTPRSASAHDQAHSSSVSGPHFLVLEPSGGALSELLAVIREAVEPEGTVQVASTQAALYEELRQPSQYDVVLVDYLLGDGSRNGRAVLAAVRAMHPTIVCIAVAKKGGVTTARRAIDSGATDFLVCGPPMKPRVATLLGKVRHYLKLTENYRGLRVEVDELTDRQMLQGSIVGDSSAMRALRSQVSRVAKVPRPVLIVGERGTGKELVARALHEEGRAHSGPLLTVNCAAFAESLLDTELFGHERGAFTNATHRARGKFELAAGGTLFLDEIANTTLAFQQKLLRVVEYGTYTRVGGEQELTARARVVAATNADLRAKIAAGQFLADLYDRLAFEVIHVPALRERSDDIEQLSQFFLQRFMREVPSFQGKCISQEAIDLLRGYPFPGNVRELKTIIERAAYRDVTQEITPEDLGLPEGLGGGTSSGRDFHTIVEQVKRDLIHDALRRCAGRQADAAKSLGLTYDQFRHYYRQYSG